ncbi:tight junction-associated protein 1 isoform X2 [Scleropages formosus]|uniref:tight junction-associated protein 1 isoform X2 n=1 Tax=Scleropages formosus TaxID=113540 RepID=UPI000878BC44|nr:tight junction-associated protein 1 isoform X2 [Scleropages formosus]
MSAIRLSRSETGRTVLERRRLLSPSSRRRPSSVHRLFLPPRHGLRGDALSRLKDSTGYLTSPDAVRLLLEPEFRSIIALRSHADSSLRKAARLSFPAVTASGLHCRSWHIASLRSNGLRMTSAGPARKPYRKAPPQHREIRHGASHFRDDLTGSTGSASVPAALLPQPEPCQDSLSDADRIKILTQQNEELRRRLAHTTHKMEAMETEFEASRHFMQAELGRAKDDLEKMRDKFRRLQNSYTGSQRANQDLEEKLHALLRKVERDKKTMDQEIVELTNKLLDAKNTVDRLEELNERYRQDCNLAVQLLKCNKSHFRNHKFADLPYELQDMVNKHMKTSLPGKGAQMPDADSQSLTPSDVVPTSVIARVLEKPEPLVLNSAQSSSSAGQPVAEDVFVHVDMTGPQAEGGRENGALGQEPPGQQQVMKQNGTCRSQNSLDGEEGSGTKLNPYPTPPPPHPLYPGRKVIEFSSDDKVKIPKNSPLPNCTYATRQAISLSLVQSEEEAGERQRTVPNSPAVSGSGASSSSSGRQRCPPQPEADPRSSQSSPFSSPPQAPSALASSASSEEDLLANWQRMFVEKMAPSSDGTLINRTSFSSDTIKDLQTSRNGKAGSGRVSQRSAYSDGEESSPRSWAASRESSVDTDTGSVDVRLRKGQYGGNFSKEESERLLMSLDPLDDGDTGDVAITTAAAHSQSSPSARRMEYADGGSAGSSEERDILPQDLPVISPRILAGLEDYTEKPPTHAGPASTTPSGRPAKSPKRMGVHHLHRKDSLTRAQEHGNLLD